MAIEIKLAQKNTISQQEGQGSEVSFGQCLKHKKTLPFSHEDVASVDTLLAKYLLVIELRQIPEFTELWRKAREIPGLETAIRIMGLAMKSLFFVLE